MSAARYPHEKEAMRRMLAFAKALSDLSWAGMAQVAEHLVYNLDTQSHVDRDFVAQVLSEMAIEMLNEAEDEKARAESAKGGGA